MYVPLMSSAAIFCRVTFVKSIATLTLDIIIESTIIESTNCVYDFFLQLEAT